MIQKLVYAAGGNTVSDIASGSGVQLFGYPVYMSDQMPADAADKCAAIFGSFSDGVINGDRAGNEVAMSDTAYFSEDVLAIRGVARNDVAVHGAGSGGALVGLFTAAS